MASNGYRDWIGRTQSSSDVITRAPAEAMAATLNRNVTSCDDGMPLPHLWHWIYFLHKPRTGILGDDGHVKRGEFLPPIDLPRRMWGGSRVRFHHPLCMGEQAQRTSRIIDVVEKQGRSGALAIVTVEHTIHGQTGLAITEEQDVVYRAPAKPGAASDTPARDPGRVSEWSTTRTADSVLLFRYSAITFNSHRIHYDHPYAVEVEGYPGLVVHGPLVATMLVEELTRHHPDRGVSALTMRALRPLFHGTPFRLEGRLSDDGMQADLWCLDERGATTMQVTAGLGA